MIKRLLLSAIACIIPLSAFATWTTERDNSDGYVTVTTLASVIDEAVPFFVVYLSDLPAGFHTAMSDAGDTDGHTIRLATSDGSTQLACYPVGVNTSTDTGALFCLGTGMSASVDTDYRIYVGNAGVSMPSVSGGYGRNTVFAAYAAAYVLNSLTDLTGNGYDMTATNSPTSGVSTGYEGITGYDFNGTSQYLVKTSGVIQNPPITIETWFNADSVAVSFYIAGVCKNSDASNNQMMLNPEGLVGGDPIRSWFRGNGGTIVQAVSTAGFTTGTWRYAACSRDSLTGGTAKAYIDGANKGTNTSDMSSVFATDRTFIGALTTTTPSGYMDGKIAAALFSASQRSDDYIATMYDNFNGDLYSAGSYTALSSCTSGSTGFVLMQTAAQTATSDKDWSTISNALIDDATAATTTLNDTVDLYSETLKLTNPAYGTSIPTGASYTVTIRVKRSAQTTSGKAIHDKVVKFIDDTGTLVGTNLADTSTTWPASATTKDYTVSGVSFDGTEFTSAAGVAIQADGSVTNGNTTTNIQAVWIKVDWTCPGATDTTRGFFALSGG